MRTVFSSLAFVYYFWAARGKCNNCIKLVPELIGTKQLNCRFENALTLNSNKVLLIVSPWKQWGEDSENSPLILQNCLFASLWDNISSVTGFLRGDFKTWNNRKRESGQLDRWALGRIATPCGAAANRITDGKWKEALTVACTGSEIISPFCYSGESYQYTLDQNQNN